MICSEYYISALNWVEDIAGVEALIKKTEENLPFHYFCGSLITGSFFNMILKNISFPIDILEKF